MLLFAKKVMFFDLQSYFCSYVFVLLVCRVLAIVLFV